MILRQYLDTSPVVAASYLFGCGGRAMGAVVDPTEDIERYLRDSEALGLPIPYVIDTHVHADHLSGGRRLAEAAGAEYVLFSGAEARYPSRRANDGDHVAPRDRGSGVGVYWPWRDLGYVAGGLLAGVLADLLGYRAGIGFVAVLTAVSSLIAQSYLPAPTAAGRRADVLRDSFDSESAAGSQGSPQSCRRSPDTGRPLRAP